MILCWATFTAIPGCMWPVSWAAGSLQEIGGYGPWGDVRSLGQKQSGQHLAGDRAYLPLKVWKKPVRLSELMEMAWGYGCESWLVSFLPLKESRAAVQWGTQEWWRCALLWRLAETTRPVWGRSDMAETEEVSWAKDCESGGISVNKGCLSGQEFLCYSLDFQS